MVVVSGGASGYWKVLQTALSARHSCMASHALGISVAARPRAYPCISTQGLHLDRHCDLAARNDDLSPVSFQVDWQMRLGFHDEKLLCRNMPLSWLLAELVTKKRLEPLLHSPMSAAAYENPRIKTYRKVSVEIITESELPP